MSSLPSPGFPALRRSLVVKLTLLGSALMGGTVALFGWIAWQTEREHAESEWKRLLEHEVRLAALRVQAFVTELGHDAKYLASTPVVRAHVTLAGDAGSEETRRRVGEGFKALVRGKASYTQLRLIGQAENGKEQVRINQSNGAISQTPAEQLQEKGDRDYVRDSMDLRAGEVLFSEMDLNQDFGGITHPYEPTLRAVAPVYRDSGERFGWIVINADLRPLLQALEDQKTANLRLYVANGAGSWLVHPRQEALFGADLGTRWGLRSSSEADAGEFERDYLFAQSEFPLGASSKRNFTVRAGCSQEDVLAGLATARRRAVLAASGAALAGTAGIALFAFLLMRRLRRVAEALRAFEPGAGMALPESPQDEVGELSAAFNRMSATIASQVRSLEQAHAEADAASQAKEAFLGVMAHEVRTPLNAVTGLLRVLERNQPAPHQEPVLRSLKAATSSLTGLLNDALDWSRLRAGKVEYRMEPLDLRALLGELELAHRPLAAQKGVAWQSDIGPLPAMVESDAARLRQILGNLLSNAVKFTDSGRVLFSASWNDGQLTCEVEDTGIGIREEDIGRIFSPFDQANGEIGRRFGGTGLGLSITRSLVEGLGGTLHAESAGTGAGSRFTITLPCPASSVAAAVVSAGPPSLAGLRVLIVEDSPSGREVILAIMEETGATLSLAEDGAQALAILRDGQPLAAALFDLQLPDTNGIDLAKAARGERPDLPVIAVTAQVTDDTRAACAAAGMSDLVPKPVDPGTLYAALAKVVPHQSSSVKAWPQLFADEPQRRARVLRALAGEFETVREKLSEAVSGQDTAAIRRLRHQLHSALHDLHLDALRAALEGLVDGQWNQAEAARTALTEALGQIHAEVGQAGN
jgi:signal transduction histidine kinase/CheY-like chemotaxis protein